MRSYWFVHQAPVGRLINAGFELLPTAGKPHYPVRMVPDHEGYAAKLLAVLGRHGTIDTTCPHPASRG